MRGHADGSQVKSASKKGEAILADFRKFTAVDGRTVWVNLDEIALAEPFNDGKQDGYVRITLVGGTQVAVQDDVRFIVGTE
jgi:hypothetical protein